MSNAPASLKIFAPAKINLYLHVTGRRDDGYHTLDSLVGFADIGDLLVLSPATALSFEITGPFAAAFSESETRATPDSSNLVIKAIWGLAELIDQPPAFHIVLEKNLPMGAGLGGGSADAAAILRLLCRYWNVPDTLAGLGSLMLSLGADMPVCFAGNATHVRGIGEQLAPGPALPETPVVLIHPGKACNTGEIFLRFQGPFGEPVTLPGQIPDIDTLCDFLAHTENMLSAAAIKTVPAIQDVLNALGAQGGCRIARMSGSGSACFGIFESDSAARQAVEQLSRENPDWWVQAGWIKG